MKKTSRVAIYFTAWVIMALAAAAGNSYNVDWEHTNVYQGIALVLVLGVLQGSTLEFAVMTLSVLIFGPYLMRKKREKGVKVDYSNKLTLLLNYNLLALTEDDVDEVMEFMYDGYMTNLSPRISAVMVTATSKPDIKQYEFTARDNYRALIRTTLMEEGKKILGGYYNEVEISRWKYFWKEYTLMGLEKFEKMLPDIVERVADDFMVIQRVSKVLKKCGQYQDLMLLSEGDHLAYSYTDKELYGAAARPYNQPLFYDSEDVFKIKGRKFDYTLVLDGDTGVPPGVVRELMAVAAANPERGIIQPALNMDSTANDPLFMNLESLRARINEPIGTIMGLFFEQGAFFGKALIKNDIYVQKVIGTRDNIIERVPIDVLSHDTFEAAVLRPLFADSVKLIEAPCYNYVTWHIRERRWNQGEVILATYFWPDTVGKFLRSIKKYLDGDEFIDTRLRTESPMDATSAYIAHSAIRQMAMKPLLLVYILLQNKAALYSAWIPLAMVAWVVIIFPKFAIITRQNWPGVLIETLASIMQYTPEPLIGTMRVIQSHVAYLFKCYTKGWVPQRAVEQSFLNSNPFVSSFAHLWKYSVVSGLAMVFFAVWDPSSYLIQFMLGCTFLTPFFVGVTALTRESKVAKNQLADTLPEYGEDDTNMYTDQGGGCCPRLAMLYPV